ILSRTKPTGLRSIPSIRLRSRSCVSPPAPLQRACTADFGSPASGSASRCSSKYYVSRTRGPSGGLTGISKRKREQKGSKDDLVEALSAYQQAMAVRNWVDFDDLIALAVRAFSNDPSLAARYRDRFASISVDEFQDLDPAQYELLRLIAPADANVCVIGD